VNSKLKVAESYLKMLNLSHKKLIAWQKAIDFLPHLYSLCDKLPSDEKYNLVSQMKRAGISVSNNLAEGCARKSKVEKNRFFEISRSSIVEVDNCLAACISIKYLTKEEIKEVEERNTELFRLVSGLIDSNNK
jgi:four helix bundle protein